MGGKLMLVFRVAEMRGRFLSMLLTPLRLMVKLQEALFLVFLVRLVLRQKEMQAELILLPIF